jgi:hypothetical protein
MRAPDHHRNRSFKDEINEFLKRYELTESSHDSAVSFFLRLRDDPDRRIDKIWKKLVDDNPSIDTASGRELFLKSLMDPWDGAFLADAITKVDAITRTARRDRETKIKKRLARSFSKTSAREFLAHLHDASTDLQLFAKAEELRESLYQIKLYPLIDIRSDHAGSRTRTVFMRLASRLMHRTTGKWNDDEVATLTDIAFPGKETTSIRMVQSARQSLRRAT